MRLPAFFLGAARRAGEDWAGAGAGPDGRFLPRPGWRGGNASDGRALDHEAAMATDGRARKRGPSDRGAPWGENARRSRQAAACLPTS